MRIAQLYRGKCEGQTFLLCNGVAVWNTQVIRLHPEQTGNQSAVCAVSVTCESKAAVQRNICVNRCFAEQLASGESNAHRTGGMAAGRPYHNRTQNIKQTHENPP